MYNGVQRGMDVRNQDIDLDTVVYFYAVQFPLTVTLQLRNRRITASL